MKTAEEKVNAVLALVKGTTYSGINSVESNSDNPWDINFNGTHTKFGRPCKFSAWLPLAAISALVDWCSPEIAGMLDYPDMAMDGDWSGVRDTDRAVLMAIFEVHVLPMIKPDSFEGKDIKKLFAESFGG